MDIQHEQLPNSKQNPQPTNKEPLDFVPLSANSLQNHPKSRLHKKTLYITLALIILLAAGGGAAVYWAATRHHDTSSTQQMSTTTPPPAAPVAQSSLVQYVSNGKDLNLSFTYPSTWSVTPPTNSNSNDKPISITSPTTSLIGANGNAVTGRVVIGIFPGGTSLPELASDKAMTAAASAQFAYTKPTTAQHQYPYLTFVHLSGGSNPSDLFEEVIVTGITSFAKDQSIIPESLTQIDPLITARFYQCSTQVCNPIDSTPLSITASAWQNTDIFSQVQAIFASMQMN